MLSKRKKMIIKNWFFNYVAPRAMFGQFIAKTGNDICVEPWNIYAFQIGIKRLQITFNDFYDDISELTETDIMYGMTNYKYKGEC